LGALRAPQSPVAFELGDRCVREAILGDRVRLDPRTIYQARGSEGCSVERKEQREQRNRVSA
jgi:hypothetical protein